MYLDKVEFIDGGTLDTLPCPTDVLCADMIASTDVETRWRVEGLLGRFEHVYRVVIKPEYVHVVMQGRVRQ